MKYFVFLLITVASFSCNKSKQIVPKLVIEKIAEPPVCGFHDVTVYEVKSEVEIDSTFFSYPNSNYLYKSLHYSYPLRNHQLIKWTRVNESDSLITTKVESLNEECDISHFKESSIPQDSSLFYSGVLIINEHDSLSYYEGLLFLNVKTNKLFVFENYDKSILW